MILVSVAGILIIVGVLWEAFETVVLPRRVTRRFRFDLDALNPRPRRVPYRMADDVAEIDVDSWPCAALACIGSEGAAA